MTTTPPPVLGALLPDVTPPDGYASLLVWIIVPMRYSSVRLTVSVDGVAVPIQQGQWRVPVLPGERVVTFTLIPSWLERYSLATTTHVTPGGSHILVFEVDFRSYRILDSTGRQVARRHNPVWLALLAVPVVLVLLLALLWGLPVALSHLALPSVHVVPS